MKMNFENGKVSRYISAAALVVALSAAAAPSAYAQSSDTGRAVEQGNLTPQHLDKLWWLIREAARQESVYQAYSYIKRKLEEWFPGDVRKQSEVKTTLRELILQALLDGRLREEEQDQAMTIILALKRMKDDQTPASGGEIQPEAPPIQAEPPPIQAAPPPIQAGPPARPEYAPPQPSPPSQASRDGQETRDTRPEHLVIYRVRVERLAGRTLPFREAPDPYSKMLWDISKARAFAATGRVEYWRGDKWIEVEYRNQMGWVSAYFIKKLKR